MGKVADKYRSSGQYFIIFNELVAAARHRGTATYQELADLIGLPVTGAYMGSEVGQVLAEISEDECGRNRPMLSAVAVSTNGKPGSGFYELARKLGKLEGGEPEDRFWEAEKQKVYERWQRKFG
jgi:hypothetical protein